MTPCPFSVAQLPRGLPAGSADAEAAVSPIARMAAKPAGEWRAATRNIVANTDRRGRQLSIAATGTARGATARVVAEWTVSTSWLAWRLAYLNSNTPHRATR